MTNPSPTLTNFTADELELARKVVRALSCDLTDHAANLHDEAFECDTNEAARRKLTKQARTAGKQVRAAEDVELALTFTPLNTHHDNR